MMRENTCNMMAVEPIMVPLPYPPTKVREKNQGYANVLSISYCGAVSEMSAIAQYINSENRLSCMKCAIAKPILGIAMAEMIHLQKLGELIYLLGGMINYTAKYRDGRQVLWTPQFLSSPEDAKDMLRVGIESEKKAIEQYWTHSKMINDEYVRAVIARIIKDEEYHMMVLQMLQTEV